MSEHLENGSSPAADHSEGDVLELLKRIQQQMVYLEKKIDTLLDQQPSNLQPSGERSFDRPSFKDRHFSKPARNFGTRTEHYGRSDREGGRPGFGGGDRPERGGYGQGRPGFGRPRRDAHRGGPGFGGPKKPFYQGRKERH